MAGIRWSLAVGRFRKVVHTHRRQSSYRDADNWISVHWCFQHARREWADQACPEPWRWQLPDGTPLLVGAMARH